jgi:hypothetical protein
MMRRPQRFPLRPLRFPASKSRWPRRVIVRPYGFAPAPYAIDATPSGSEHVRWAQIALNETLGLRLPIHGVMDAATRSAIRSFQQRQGLPVDGVLGPETERALSAARRGRMEGGAPASASSGAEPAAAAAEPAAAPEPPPPAEGAEGEFSQWGRSCGCPACRRGEPCSCQSRGTGSFQSEAFEFEPETASNEFESGFGAFESGFGEFENGAPEWPRWPTSRTFNPTAGSIPTGPFKTSAPCRAMVDDFTKLTLAVDDLKRHLRQSPPDRRTVSNRVTVVRALSREIVRRLQELHYKQTCTRDDFKTFASSVSAMRGPGADGDAGNWPQGSANVQNRRTAARESLRHLLNWIRRAERNFPRI